LPRLRLFHYACSYLAKIDPQDQGATAVLLFNMIRFIAGGWCLHKLSKIKIKTPTPTSKPNNVDNYYEQQQQQQQRQ